MKCPYCDIDIDNDYYDVEYNQDGTDLDIIYRYNCCNCDQYWRYVERFAMTDCWYER